MRFLIRALLFLVVVGGLVLGAAYVFAGTQPGPSIEVKSPDKFIGQNSPLEFFVQAPNGQFSRVEAVLEQEGQSSTVFSLDPSKSGDAQVKQAAADRLWVIRTIGKQAMPTLKAGKARLTITASRPVIYGIREATTSDVRDLEVRLDPPRVAVVSLHHFIRHGGSEFVVYRATPPDVTSGVRVGEAEFRGVPGSSVGMTDPALHVVFFVLAHDQDANAPISVFARDVAGNMATANLDHKLFPGAFGKSNIEITDAFLQAVVPQITQGSPNANIPSGDPVQAFLKINTDLRRENNKQITDLAAKSKPEMLWQEAFSLGNINVEARFADYRTYFYKGKEIDRQVHLGYDLATFQHAPVPASNRGIVLLARDLGIYGNAVILDHGLGVQSLYGHLSAIGVKEGDTVEKGQTLGQSGTTGLAAGDHLHFTMVVNGVQVNPVEWWDPHWMEDRVFRKIREAGGKAPTLK